MGQIDEIHDAEGQGQPGGEQKQQHAKLHSIQKLDQDQRCIHLGQTPLKHPPKAWDLAWNSKGEKGVVSAFLCVPSLGELWRNLRQSVIAHPAGPGHVVVREREW